MDNVHKFDGIYHIGGNAQSPMCHMIIFPADKLLVLRKNILADKWFIPVKLDEPLGLCMQSAIQMVEKGQLNQSTDCQQFIETIIPEAFRKVKIPTRELWGSTNVSACFSYKLLNRSLPGPVKFTVESSTCSSSLSTWPALVFVSHLCPFNCWAHSILFVSFSLRFVVIDMSRLELRLQHNILAEA